MFLLAVDLDELTPFRQVVQRVPVGVELAAQLVKIGHLTVGTQANAALCGLQLPKQQPHQCGLTGAVLPHQAYLVAAQHGQCQVADDRPAVGVVETGAEGIHHQLAGTGRVLHGERGGPDPFPALPALLPHGLEGPHAAHVTGAACLDPLANPRLLLLQPLVEQRVLAFFLLKGLFLEFEVAIVAGRKTHQVSPIQLDHPGGHASDKGPVVGDENNGSTELPQGLFQPRNGRHVQVVGRLVQQQDVRIRYQGLRQQHPPLPAA